MKYAETIQQTDTDGAIKLLEHYFKGQYIRVEDFITPEAKALDMNYGIDLFRVEGEKMHGMALRIQQGDYKTFTIRSKRQSGSLTEYAKRVRAIRENDLYPSFTIQIYFFNGFHRIGVVKTVDLYAYLENHQAKEYVNRQEPERVVSFVAVSFYELQQAGYKVTVIDNS